MDRFYRALSLLAFIGVIILGIDRLRDYLAWKHWGPIIDAELSKTGHTNKEGGA